MQFPFHFRFDFFICNMYLYYAWDFAPPASAWRGIGIGVPVTSRGTKQISVSLSFFFLARRRSSVIGCNTYIDLNRIGREHLRKDFLIITLRGFFSIVICRRCVFLSSTRASFSLNLWHHTSFLRRSSHLEQLPASFDHKSSTQSSFIFLNRLSSLLSAWSSFYSWTVNPVIGDLLPCAPISASSRLCSFGSLHAWTAFSFQLHWITKFNPAIIDLLSNLLSSLLSAAYSPLEPSNWSLVISTRALFSYFSQF